MKIIGRIKPSLSAIVISGCTILSSSLLAQTRFDLSFKVGTLIPTGRNIIPVYNPGMLGSLSLSYFLTPDLAISSFASYGRLAHPNNNLNIFPLKLGARYYFKPISRNSRLQSAISVGIGQYWLKDKAASSRKFGGYGGMSLEYILNENLRVLLSAGGHEILIDKFKETYDLLEINAGLSVHFGKKFKKEFPPTRKLKMEEYQKELAYWQNRETTARGKIMRLKSALIVLNTQIQSIQKEINETWTNLYNLLGTDSIQVREYLSNIKNLQHLIQELNLLSNKELSKRKDEIERTEDALKNLRENQLFALTDAQRGIKLAVETLKIIKARIPVLEYETYIVKKGDCLWRIAAKKEIYNDPYKWLRIYSFNRDILENPDMLYPGMEIRIPREIGPRSYIIQKGDTLAKIAFRIHGDSMKWKDIYEMNKDVIEDPNRIYPQLILKMPQD